MRDHVPGMLLLLWLSGCGFDDSHDANQSVHTGDDARGQILKWAHSAVRLGDNGGGLPASAKNFWLFAGGTFNGSITYWTFDCDNREDCMRAVGYLGDLRPVDFKPWAPSRYAVVMGGLDYYSTFENPRNKRPRSHPWDVRGIKNGLVYERVEGDHRRMVYYAIDFDRNRVYYHYESGGFPPDEYRPDAAGKGRLTKPP